MNAAFFQAVAVTPLLLLLAGFTITHPVRKTVHRYLLGILMTMTVWCLMVGVAFSDFDASVRSACFLLSNLGSAILTALCVLTIGHYVRIEAVESGRANWLVWPPTAFFSIAMLTDPLHHAMFSDRTALMALETPDHWGGPIFWAFTGWAFLATFVSAGIVGVGFKRCRTRADRQRMLLILGAISAPVISHAAFVGSWLPIDYPLTPASFGVTGLLLVAGVQRFELLDRRPVVRRDVIEHLSDGLLVASADGIVVDANPLALDMLGALPGEVIGSSLEAAAARLTRGANHVRSTDETDPEAWCATEVETADGRTIELHPVVIGAGEGPEGGIEGRALMLRDRSAERRNERILHHRQKLESVGILAAGVAHEVNNPLAYVRSNLAHLRLLAAEIEKAPDSANATVHLDELREVVDESLTGLDRIARIVERLLRFSRPSEDRRPLDVNELVEEAMRFASLHRGEDIAVTSDLTEDLPRVEGSVDRLLQAVLNLLLNARQALASHDGPRIRVETRLDRDEERAWISIAVADNGTGVPTSVRERIFDPFFTTRAPGEGTGLGLSIAFDIVRDHDGTLELESPATGGARFVIRLPVGSGAGA
ncbi:MAG: ATP-binding protein [Myxococcota bacterium]